MELSSILSRFNVDNGTLPYRVSNMTRDDLAHMLGEMEMKAGAEIGVWRGAYSLRLCQSIPDVKLKCVDPWLPFRRNSQIRMDSYFRIASRRVRPYGAEIIKKTSLEAVRDVPDKSLDFVYIDGMHEFDFVMVDLILWADKVRPGGIVSGHDYDTPTWCNGVMRAVEAYTKEHNISPWYITMDEGENMPPSFFWVKP